MSHKTGRIATLIQNCHGQALDPHYLAFFECFNRQLFFEAHEVLEELWLRERGGPRDLFFKGLIQLAGAFVHVQKNRPVPAGALFELARKNLQPYGPRYEKLDLGPVLELIKAWREKVQKTAAFPGEIFTAGPPSVRLTP